VKTKASLIAIKAENITTCTCLVKMTKTAAHNLHPVVDAGAVQSISG